MAEDRSLDEFAGSDSTSGDDDPAEDAEEPAAEPEPSTEEVEPAITTSAWDSDGAACERCGERPERRWVDDGALVCADCKTW